MGRLSHAASRVHTHAAAVLHNTTHTYPPPWLATIQTTPPPQKLVRPVLRRTSKPGKRTARQFQPVALSYEEDNLRWEYFNDHPWELARPRVVLENDGRDRERWDWSQPLDAELRRPRQGSKEEARWEAAMKGQSGRPINGEAVVLRQKHLIKTTSMSNEEAYDTARKELYRMRHFREIETRVAREEAQSTGAFFTMGPLEVGMKLEDQAYEHWKQWAIKEAAALKVLQGSAYSGVGTEEGEEAMAPDVEGEAAEMVEASVPRSKKGLEAKGGAAVHP